MHEWKPHVTVAAVIERNNQFLLVEEHTERGIRYNQPAGHLEQHESLIEAVVRETLEETAYHFIPRAVLGIYHWTPPAMPQMTYLRIAFVGEVIEPREKRELDDGIIRAEWFDLQTIRALAPQHRSPQVLSCIDDYLAGQHFPLSLLHYLNGAHRE
jgi:8-oxo-dGTP pyrophosphatase MutT (NUDIX family)